MRVYSMLKLAFTVNFMHAPTGGVNTNVIQPLNEPVQEQTLI